MKLDAGEVKVKWDGTSERVGQTRWKRQGESRQVQQVQQGSKPARAGTANQAVATTHYIGLFGLLN
jgi:hypothetical protein